MQISEFIPTLKSVASNYKISKHDQEDVVQDVLLEFWRKKLDGRVDDEKNVMGYLVKLLRWRIKDKFDKINVRAKYLVPLDLFDGEAKPEASSEKLEILHRAIEDVRQNKKTKPQQWQIFWHAYTGDDIMATANHFSVDRSVVDVVKCRMQKKIINRAQEILNS